MYLKSIKAQGFKSFADKTTIVFDKDITAIVGPNGSGKSNVVDAIRWVLGEQSVKELRGSNIMSDVIFSGSKNRDGQKRASVTLTFDNTDHYLNSDFDELEIKREVYKTGENDYYINNTKVRLKDVKNLFLDSGAGSGAFNIISQGNITEIVGGRPIDRRYIFESAAGVLKYKTRKEESIKKLAKTKENLNSINLLIDELKINVEPLKKQSDNAKLYLEYKKELESIEIALISEDTREYSSRCSEIKEEIDEISNLVNTASIDLVQSKIETKKVFNIKLEEEINTLNNQIITINNDIAKLASEKQITIERQRFSTKNTNVNDALLKLKEEESELLKNKEIINGELEKLKNDKNTLNSEIDKLSNDLINLKIKRSTHSNILDSINKELLVMQNKIEIAKNNIENGEFYPKSVRSVINNTRLKGIINTVGNLIDIPLKYKTASDVILSSSTNFIVTNDFECAKDAINYLKTNNMGRATFYPIDVIKSRYLKKDIISLIEGVEGFVGILSDLVDYNVKYKNIVENLLGNVVVVNTVDDLKKMGAILEYRQRIVSLDGEVLFAGGALSGGALENNRNNQNNLKILERDYDKLKTDAKASNKVMDSINIEFNMIDEKLDLYNKKYVLMNESINNKDTLFSEVLYKLENKELELKGINNVANNKLDDELINIIEALTNKAKEKINLEATLNSKKELRSDSFDELTSLEQEYKTGINDLSKTNNIIKNLEIELGRLDVKIDSNLNTLSETYSMTYEYAKDNYFLVEDKEESRKLIKTLKRDIDKLGVINIGSIDEYERVSTRYNFLLNQEKDLVDATNNLLSIIKDMDLIMIERFKRSFEEVSKEFKIVFNKIFQGGEGKLVLTDPTDYLNTGIDIIAQPPGKKLNSTIALSGGEKSLTAIALLFAILNVKPVPFIVLDEAEAALDEANVDMFGKYINELISETQFILITHKKRMMEYANVLYGITMQESGVSKIVSTKLEV